MPNIYEKCVKTTSKNHLRNYCRNLESLAREVFGAYSGDARDVFGECPGHLVGI